MKLCIFVIFVCLQTALPLAQGQSIRDQIDEFIQHLKNLIPDPVEVPDVGITLPENEYLAGNINITNGIISGLRDFGVNVDYSGIIIPIPTGFTLTIDDVDSYIKFLSSLKVNDANAAFLNYDVDASFRNAAKKPHHHMVVDIVDRYKLIYGSKPLKYTIWNAFSPFVHPNKGTNPRSRQKEAHETHQRHTSLIMYVGARETTICTTVTSDLVIKAELDFTLIPLSVSLTSLWYNIGGLQFDIQGVFSDRFSNILSVILSNTVANILNLVQEPVSERLVDIINSIISGIANEVNESNSGSVYAATSQEKGVENVAKFFEILENRLGLRS